jgi:integrase
MRKHHPENERIKRRYLTFLREAKRLSVASVDHAAAAIAAFETANGYRDLRKFDVEQALKFKRVLDQHINPETGKPLAKATVHARLMAVKAFVVWLADQPGYRARIRYSHAEYFNPSANDTRIAKTVRERPAPSLEQIRHVLSVMPNGTDIERRDRALIAFTILTGARDNAIASLSLKHVDVRRRVVIQDAREVRTKRAKTITTYFFPVGVDIEAIVTDWIAWLRTERLFGDDDPLFPATKVAPGKDRRFEVVGLDRSHWRSASAIRRIFHESFEAASLPYFHPHSFRHTLVAMGQRMPLSPEQFKSWSQNIGHDNVLTTFTSYGCVSAGRVEEIFAELRKPALSPKEAEPDEKMLREFLAWSRGHSSPGH